jgi:ABC-type amino acid transport substrate-binding protein
VSAFVSAAQIAAGALIAVWLAAPLARSEAVGDAAPAESGTEAEDALVAALAEAWTGDLDAIVERGYLRFGVAYNPLLFSYDGPNQRGLSVDIAAEFEKHLRKTLGKPASTLTVALTPLPRESMFDALIEGRVDVLAANLTTTPERTARVDFADPIYSGVAEIVITAADAPAIESFDDLVATEVHVRRSSSYFEHLTAFNARRGADPHGRWFRRDPARASGRARAAGQQHGRRERLGIDRRGRDPGYRQALCGRQEALDLPDLTLGDRPGRCGSAPASGRRWRDPAAGPGAAQDRARAPAAMTLKASASAYQVDRWDRPRRHQRSTSDGLYLRLRGRGEPRCWYCRLLKVRIQDRFAGRAPSPPGYLGESAILH